MLRLFIAALSIFCFLEATSQANEKQFHDSLALPLNDKTKINLLIKLARQVATHSPDSALQLATNASLIAKRNENEKDLSRVYRLFGKIYYDLGKYSTAIENHKTAFIHSQKMHDSLQMSAEMNDMGRAYRRMGVTKEALTYMQQGLDLAGKDKSMIGIIFNNLALVLNDIGDDSLALQYYHKSLSIAEESKDTTSIILSLNNLGGQYFKLKNLKKEEECYVLALTLAEKANDTRSFGVTYDNIGSMWEDRGNLQKAFTYFQKELEYERKSGVKVYVAEALQSMTGVCIKMKNYQMALNYAIEGFKLSEEIQSAELRAAASRKLSAVFENLKHFEQAFHYMKIANTISDSLNSIEKAKVISNLASRYELTKKETEIKTLSLEKQIQKTELQQESKVRNGLIIFLAVVTVLLLVTVYLYRERKKANEMLTVWSEAVDQKNQELDNLNKVKDKIFSSIAHDVRSPLASLQSLISLMNRNILSPDELHKITLELSARVNTTSAFLENLLNWSKNQIATTKANPVRTNIQSLVNECIELYSSNAKEKDIKLLNKIHEPSFIFADEEMIRITLRNLISNAIKFTCSEGDVKINAIRTDNILCISVSDSGVGIPQEDVEKIFSFEAYTTPGTAKEKGTGLGLILCKEFIEKNGGEISVDSRQGEGSTFSFTVPVV